MILNLELQHIKKQLLNIDLSKVKILHMIQEKSKVNYDELEIPSQTSNGSNHQFEHKKIEIINNYIKSVNKMNGCLKSERQRQLDNCKQKFKKKLDILEIKQKELKDRYQDKFKAYSNQHTVLLNLKKEVLEQLNEPETPKTDDTYLKLVSKSTVNIDDIEIDDTSSRNQNDIEEICEFFKTNQE